MRECWYAPDKTTRVLWHVLQGRKDTDGRNHSQENPEYCQSANAVEILFDKGGENEYDTRKRQGTT